VSSRRRFLGMLGGSAAAALLPYPEGARPLAADSSRAVVFTDVTGPAGLLGAVNVSGSPDDKQFLLEEMGGGASFFDYDHDGWLDIFLVNGSLLDPAVKDRRPRSYLFHNNRDGTFTDVTDKAGLLHSGWGQGCCVGDYDNDGFDDLFVTYWGKSVLYHNNGDGTFTDVSEKAGVAGRPGRWGAGCCFLDYDRDGHLDLFVARYLDFSLASNKVCNDSVGARDYCSPRAYKPVPSKLYRNGGDGRFTDVTERAGISKAFGAGLGVSMGDYNGDGWPDLYVANDATPNQLWINRQDGTFGDEGLLAGAALNAAGNPEGSMGIASGDFDLDGDEDLFVTNIIGETFALYVNDGKANFEDGRTRAGLAGPTAPSTGFGTDWLDYDNDGRLDLFVANGAVNVIEAQRGQVRPFRMKNQLFHNSGDGRFTEATAEGGAAFARAGISRGAAIGDIDNDGDVDVVVTDNGGPAQLLLNQSVENGGKNHWLSVAVRQAATNRFALGAWIGVERTGKPTLWRRVRTDGSYLSARDPRVHFGLGDSPAITALVIEWPDGQRERRTDVTAGAHVITRR
jgi:hypothetical protein